MPSEMVEFSFEIAIWLVLGILLLSWTMNMGIRVSQLNFAFQINNVADYVAANVNIAGSRNTEVHIRLPETIDGNSYTIHTYDKTILIEGGGLSKTRETLYSMPNQLLYAGKDYVIRPKMNTLVFLEE